jgi:hypothetical protein
MDEINLGVPRGPDTAKDSPAAQVVIATRMLRSVPVQGQSPAYPVI